MIIGQCIHDMAVSHGLVISLFLAGLVGGFTHCMGMCGPFVLAQTGEIKKLTGGLLLPYHLGRMTTYVALAVLVSSLINLAFIFSDLKALIAAPMLVLAGTIFLITAFPRLSTVFPWAVRFQITAPYKLVMRLSAKFMKNPNVFKRYGLGVLLGFMPCGLVVSALLASASAPSVWDAALAMAAFALGTVPALAVVALGGRQLSKHYPNASKHVRQGAMVVSSLWLFVLAGAMVF